jgi:hypothetical protein
MRGKDASIGEAKWATPRILDTEQAVRKKISSFIMNSRWTSSVGRLEVIKFSSANSKPTCKSRNRPSVITVTQ